MRKLLPLITLAAAAALVLRAVRKPIALATPATSAELLAQYLTAGNAGPRTGASVIPSWSINDPQAPPSGALR